MFFGRWARLIPLATVITPNRREAAALTNRDAETVATDVQSAKDTARRLTDLGTHAAIVKGIPVSDKIVDLFFDGEEFIEFAGNAHSRSRTHGSGCAFSAAITAGLAAGLPLVAAIDQAKRLVTTAIEFGEANGRGTTSINVLAYTPDKRPGTAS